MTNQLEQLYQQVILDHARSAHGRGLAVADAAGHPHGESHQVNPTCGDEVTLRVALSADGRTTVEQVSWDGQGCSISQASLSVLTDLVTGRSAEEAEQLGETFRALMASQGKGLDESLEDALGDATAFTGVSQFPARIKCALLGWAALRDALAKAGAASATQDLSQEES
ncbi:Fe-S cluster assembly sulfur transfer protein SufU [Luteimicrobium sp. NPDC057192]|uniref:Fe-S cluster assembly sulfur transfer protein SufU n=1 Tax=Luteimicrobium sp. NPDC057192 TaxID=3346042 RepID=UPI00362DE78B